MDPRGNILDWWQQQSLEDAPESFPISFVWEFYILNISPAWLYLCGSEASAFSLLFPQFINEGQKH